MRTIFQALRKTASKGLPMKLVIASDIHGAADACARLMSAIEAESPDRVVLLGDLLYHGPRNDLPADYAPKRVIEMLNSIADRVIAVRGNCEAAPCSGVNQNVVVRHARRTTTFWLTPLQGAAPSRSSSHTGTSTAPATTTASTRGPRCPSAPPWSTVTRTSR